MNTQPVPVVKSCEKNNFSQVQVPLSKSCTQHFYLRGTGTGTTSHNYKTYSTNQYFFV